MFNKLLILLCLLSFVFSTQAQPPLPIFKGGTKEERQKFYDRSVATINDHLSQPIDEYTEENWATAFDMANLLNHRSDFVAHKIDSAANNMQGRSDLYLMSLLDLLNNQYPQYQQQVHNLALSTTSAKIFAKSYAYLKLHSAAFSKYDLKKQMQKFKPNNPVLQYFLIQEQAADRPKMNLQPFFAKNYLPKQVVVISLQRKNRNYPGLALVRDTLGNFITLGDSAYFAVPQLARSLSNMPGTISLGNTPQGILRMDGFGVSKGFFIGPTTNVQLTLPFELKPKHFFKDSTLNDTAWRFNNYLKLLPSECRSNISLYEAWFAGMAGRNEIIAHGTTVEPKFYFDEPYFPLTPTAGCLATEEWWSTTTGRRTKSNQQELADAITKAGGPFGYFIVLELNDEQKPVRLEDALPYLPKINQ